MVATDLSLLLGFLEVLDPRSRRSSEGLSRWLVEHGLVDPGASLGDGEFQHAIHVRAAITALLHEKHGTAPDARTRPTLEAVTSAAPLRLEIAPGGPPRLVPVGGGLDAALARIVSILYSADISGELDRLKACKQCGWPFVDTTKNRSRVWCDMATCGSQQKARAYRSRRAAGSAPDR